MKSLNREFEILERPSEDYVLKVTRQVVEMYTQRRMQIFQVDVGTRSKLYSQSIRRHHAGPTDTIGELQYLH